MEENKVTKMTRSVTLPYAEFYKCETCQKVSTALEYGAYSYCPYCGYRIEWDLADLIVRPTKKEKKRWWKRRI